MLMLCYIGCCSGTRLSFESMSKRRISAISAFYAVLAMLLPLSPGMALLPSLPKIVLSYCEVIMEDYRPSCNWLLFYKLPERDYLA
jgi:hypothetical protein